MRVWARALGRFGGDRPRDVTGRRGATRSRHVDAERPAGVLIHHVRDGHSRDHLDEVGCDAPVQAPHAFALNDLAERTAHCALRALCCFLWKIKQEISKIHIHWINLLAKSTFNWKASRNLKRSKSNCSLNCDKQMW